MGKMTGSDPNKYLFLWNNRCNLGRFFLLDAGFWGQKVGFKGFAWGQAFLIIVIGVSRKGAKALKKIIYHQRQAFTYSKGTFVQSVQRAAWTSGGTVVTF